MIVYESECLAAGLDPAEVRRIARRIERAAKDAQRLGLQVFGGSTSGSLRFDDGGRRPLIVADMGGSWSGGDGAAMPDDAGLLRGE